MITKQDAISKFELLLKEPQYNGFKIIKVFDSKTDFYFLLAEDADENMINTDFFPAINKETGEFESFQEPIPT